MSHYYQNDEHLMSDIRILKLYILGRQLNFYSDTGVFSNKEIDYGSYTFLKTLLSLSPFQNVLDVGCGYGTLGLTLRYFSFCESVDMIDINQRAIDLTLKNLKQFKLTNVNVFCSNGFEQISKKYDQIVINPPIRAGKTVIYKMFEDSVAHLNAKGALYIVIKKNLGAESAIKKLQDLFVHVEVLNKDKGYYIIKSFNEV